MNHDQFKKGIKEIRGIKLSSVEKKQILERVLDSKVVSPYAPRISFWETFLHQSRSAYVFASLFLFVSIGSVLAYNAEKTIPGDNLYFLKVGVTEPARDLVNISPEKKAEWESVKTVRRVDEALNLAAEGKLNEKNRSDLEARFNKHSQAFDTSVTALASSTKKSKKSELIKIEFEADLSAKARAIENLEQKFRESDEIKESREKQGQKNDKKKNEESELNKFKKAVSKKLEKIEDEEDSGD